MPKKHYCQKCQSLIEEGKGIKVHKGSNYSSSRYSSYPRDYYIYYLCPKCHQQEYEESRARNERIWKQVSWSLLIVVSILIIIVIIFLVYQYRQDKKIDRITKKSQKVKK